MDENITNSTLHYVTYDMDFDKGVYSLEIIRQILLESILSQNEFCLSYIGDTRTVLKTRPITD